MHSNAEVVKFHDAIYERLLAEVNAKDDLANRLGDTLDVKMSIGLVLITFLSTQTAFFLDKYRSGFPHNIQIISGCVLAAAIVAAFIELWPRTYLMPYPESSGIARAIELNEFYSQHENVRAETMVAEFTKNEIGWSEIRILTNGRNNNKKSFWLRVSLSLTAIAIILNTAVCARSE
jgi:hypothetical protein